MTIFKKNKVYKFKQISDICNKNGLATVDCLKDDNMVSVEKEVDGDCLFEFHRIGYDLFKLTWIETDPELMFRPNKSSQDNQKHKSRYNN